MFHRQRPTPEERKQFREALTAEITEDVQAAIDELLAEVPTDWDKDIKDGIRTSVLANTQWVLDALSVDELSSQVARQIHLFNAKTETRNLITLQADQNRRR